MKHVFKIDEVSSCYNFLLHLFKKIVFILVKIYWTKKDPPEDSKMNELKRKQNF